MIRAEQTLWNDEGGWSAFFIVITSNPQQKSESVGKWPSQFFTQESISIPTPRKQLSPAAGGENASLGVRCEY
jgi:hypothetical protein